ncbi:MAG: sulfite exporter TauE/SafE family protein, partial [Thermoleophilaceae bacterium]|nr:sulfite exporter TauE/SafE family protein [Thermoleophilaceae bacterium]
GFGVGLMVGMTGMGGGSLMTPLLVLLFGVKPTLAVGTDIAYQAVTKTVGGYKHFKLKTVNFGAALWLAAGSVPGAVGGVRVVSLAKDRYGDDVETFTLIALGAVLALVGIFTLTRSILFPTFQSSDGVDHVTLTTRLKITAIAIGVTTGFIIGITSAGSGTVIAVALIAIFKLPPRYVVGTDVFHAAMLLWAAGLAHWAGGTVDFALMGTLLIGSIPGVWIGSQLSVKVPEATLRTALGTVLVLSASATLAKADIEYLPAVLIGGMLAFYVTITILILTHRLINPWKAELHLHKRGESAGLEPTAMPAPTVRPPLEL